MNILIVGAGFSGCVVARELAEAGHQIYVIDKRHHIGGNCYDYVNEHGIRVHKYGPHSFHTNNKTVWDWLNRYSTWIDYKHKAKSLLSDGTYVTMPINKETKKIVGEDKLIDTLVRPYSEKMWGKSLEDIDASIINRLPMRDDDNELYFPNDKYQGLPEQGYTELFKNILDHGNIRYSIAAEYMKLMNDKYDFIFNCMPIDQYFDYCYGELPYRSMKFHTVHIPLKKILPVAQVNFTNTSPYTRIVEWKNFPNHGTNEFMTTLTYEEPCDYRDNNMERYYPVKDKTGMNKIKYQKYKKLTPKNMMFIGRCGMYVYVDMHQAVSSALATARSFLND